MEYDERYTRYQRNRSAFRRFVRQLYLASATRQLSGPTLDFGCGIGELLRRLPSGSKGLEYNKDTVTYCRSQGLDVQWYDGFQDDWTLSSISGATFKSMVLSHVLEHLDDPGRVLDKLLAAASNLGVQRVLIVVPGLAGYRSDSTHRTFVDKELLARALEKNHAWRVVSQRFFPFNFRWIGKLFKHHELQVLLAKSAAS